MISHVAVFKANLGSVFPVVILMPPTLDVALYQFLNTDRVNQPGASTFGENW